MSKRSYRVLSAFSGNIKKIGNILLLMRVISQRAPWGAIWEGQYTGGVFLVAYSCFWQIEQGVYVDEVEIFYFKLV